MESPNNGNQAKIIDEILSALPDVVVIYDKGCRILYANQRYAEALGVKQADVIGKKMREIGRPKDVYAPTEAQIKEVIETKKPLTLERDTLLPGGLRHFEYVMEPLFRDDGSVASVLTTSRDVTEQRKAQEDIKESRRQVLDILESISDGFFALDALWRVTYINGRAQELLGLSREDVLFKSIWQKLPNAQVLNLYKKLTAAIEDQQVTSLEEHIPYLNKWFEFHIYPYENGTSVYFSDITERKRAEEALRESEKRFRSLFENMLDGYAYCKMLFAEDGRPVDFIYLAVNDAFEKLTGLENVVGRKVTEVIPGVREAEPELFETYGQVALTGKSERFEIDFKPLGLWLSISVYSPQKEHFVAVFDNITERKLAEQERERLIEGLEVLHEITAIAAHTLDISAVSQQVLDKLAERLSLAYANIYVLDHANKELRPTALYGYPPEFYKSIPPIAVDAAYSSAEVFRSGVAQIVENIEAFSMPQASKEAARKLEATTGVAAKSYVMLPLVAYKSRVGVLVLIWSTPRAFSREDRGFFTSIAYEIAVGLENARLYEAEIAAQKQANYELDLSNLLLKAADTLTASIDLNEVLARLADIMLEATGLSRVFINLIDMDKLELIPKVATGGLNAPVGPVISFDQLSQTSRAAIFAKKAAVLDYELPETPEYDRKIAQANNCRLALFVPLLLKGETIGHIVLDEPGQRHQFTEREIKICEGIASQATVAIENAMLHALTEEELTRTKLLQEVAVAATTGPDLKTVTNEILKTLNEHMHLKTGSIFVLDDSKKILRLVSSRGYPKVAIDRFSEIPVDESGLLSTKSIRKRVITTDKDEAPTEETAQRVKAAGLENARYLSAPIEYRDKIIGVLGLAFEGKRDFTQAELELFQTIAKTIGQSIENARLFEEEKETSKLSDALNSINTSISSSLDFDQIMHRIIDEAVIAIGAETGAVIFREDDHWLTKYSYGYEENIIGVTLTDEEAPHAALAANLKEPVVINDAYNDPGVNLEIMKRYSIRSVITVPLIAKGNNVGILFLNYLTAPVTFTQAQIDFARKLSASVSLAIENARLYEAERTIADTLQSALLTIPEHIEGVEYAYRYRSATEAAKVGGDFFDIFELEHDRVGIVVGDVSGKGLQAASITALVKNTIRAYAYEETSPAVIVQKTNEAVRRVTPASYFITLFFGVVDRKFGDISYCSAGHPPALLKRADTVEPLSIYSPIIGAFSGVAYEEGHAKIEGGETLILYTDGVTEARCDGEFFGEERLVAFLKDLATASAEETTQAIFDETMCFTGGKLSDDLVLLSLTLFGAEVSHS